MATRKKTRSRNVKKPRAKKAAAKKAAPPQKKTAKKSASAKKSPLAKPALRSIGQRTRPARAALLRRQPAPRTPLRKSDNPYDRDLPRVAANFQPLTPLSMLERAASVFPNHVAVIHGKARLSYADFFSRCRKLASALADKGIKKGDTVAAMLANTPAMLEAHQAVPMTGAVLNALNTRLDAASIAYMLEHGGAKILIADREFSATVKAALALLKHPPLLIDYDDPEFPQGPESLGLDYETFLNTGDEDYAWAMPGDEWDAIALNYTSGTTGKPKGVVYHHRGAALMGYSNMLAGNMGRHPVLLWTLPMFHCNGWCFPWSLSVQAGTHVCLRQVRAGAIFQALAEHGVTHLCGAPVVMSALINAEEKDRREFSQRVTFMVAAAPPPEATLAAMAEAGFDIVHVYGLTEVYGPAVVNEWHQEWDGLSSGPRATKQARQGVRYHALEGLSVRDPQTMEAVAPGVLGEVMFRGNIVMKGYLGNAEATRAAFAGGWFHSGDLGVLYDDGYIQLKDRSKDIIISGGENISSIEVEDALAKHPAVLFAAVVAKPDAKWGETVCAFVELKNGHTSVTADAIITHCRQELARFKVPRFVVFGELPKTSTGKIQKFRLRELAKDIEE
jgi:fatty-acyl-CoA synthase